MKVFDMDGSGWAANLTGAAIISTILVGVIAALSLAFGFHPDYLRGWVAVFLMQVVVGWIDRSDWDVEPPAKGEG